MSDFHQSGPVTALPRLFARPVEELETRIQTLGFPVALVIPLVPSEMDRPALSRMVFTEALRASIEEFLADPLGAPLVPNWARVWAGVPDAGRRLQDAVERQGQPRMVAGGTRAAIR